MEQLFGGLKLVDLIKLCRECNVESISVNKNNVKIDFKKTDDVISHDAPLSNKPIDIGPVFEPEFSEEQRNLLAKLQEEEWLENLKINNPLLYEEMLARGEVEDVQDEQNNRGLESSI